METNEKQSPKGPITETQISVSKDGKWLIHKTIITDIKAVNYYKAVLAKQASTEA